MLTLQGVLAAEDVARVVEGLAGASFRDGRKTAGSELPDLMVLLAMLVIAGVVITGVVLVLSGI